MRTSASLLQRTCPGCGVLAEPGEPCCRNCGICLSGPQAAELCWIEAEIKRVVAARTWLVNRRLALLAELYQQLTPVAVGVTAGAPGLAESAGPATVGPEMTGPATAGPATAGPATAGRPDRPEVSVRTAARLLLATGALLVVVAAIGFAVANWGRVGPLGRCAMLLGVTVVVLPAPRYLLRRGVTATAEAVAAVGMSLMIADAYLAWRIIPGAAGGPLTVAAACAALAGAWAAYGVAVKLKGPRLAAIVAGQLPGLIATGPLARLLGDAFAVRLALLVLALAATASADALLASWLGRRGHQAELRVSSVAATAAWSAGALLALAGAGLTADRALMPWWSVALVALAVAGMAVLPASPWTPHAPIAVGSGALLAVGLAIPAAGLLPPGWGLAALVVAAAAVAVGALTWARSLARRAVESQDRAARRARFAAIGSAGVLTLAGLVVAPAALTDLFPPRSFFQAWTGPAIARTWLPAWPGVQAVPAVLAIVSLACWLAPVTRKEHTRAVALVTAMLAAGAVPATAHLPVLATLVVLTAAATSLLALSLAARSRLLAGTAAGCGAVLAASAALRALATPTATIVELSVLAAVCCLVAARARDARCAVISTASAVIFATCLACAVPLAVGWPARYAAFAALAVSVAAVGIGTVVRRARPAHGLVLDLAAGPVLLACAVLAADRADTFAVVAAAAAVLASTTAWLRTGTRRAVALAAAGCAVLAALAAQWRSLTAAVLGPWRLLGQSWQGHSLAYVHVAGSAGLPLAAVVLATCLAALVVAAGAWRGSARGSLDAVAAALPLVAAPAGLAGGLGYWSTVGLMLALTLALTGWAALGESLAPAGAALVAAALTIGWALAAPLPTLVVLGCLCVGYALCAWRARRLEVRVAAACLSVLAALATWCAGLLAAGVNLPEAYTLPAAAVAVTAGWAWSRRRPGVSSWLAYGPALAALLGPSLIGAWNGTGWIRPALLGLAAAVVALAGARARLQAPLVTGAAVAALDAGRELTPSALSLVRAAPGWAPFALVGVGLLWAGATYEARLRNLSSARRSLAAMR